MAIEQTLESLEAVRKAMEAIKADRTEAAQYLAFIDGELEKLQTQERELAAQSVGQYRGRSNWTHEEAVEVRRRIRTATGEARTMGEIAQTMPEVDRALIEREMEYLVNRRVMRWTGGRGTASKYVRA